MVRKTSKRKKGNSVSGDFEGYIQVSEEPTEPVIASEPTPQLPPSLELAKRLEGSPVVFGENYQAALKVLVKEGVAADFGDEGHARGHKWRQFIKNS